MPNDKKRLIDLDLNGNEIQNAVEQNLGTAPSNPKEGQFYWNSTNKKDYIFDGTNWVERTSQGRVYNAGTGIDSTALASGTIKTDTTIASKTDIGSANLTIQRNGTGIGTFSANATSAVTVNISVPTTATEVGALPSDTVIGNGALTIQRNGTAVGTFTANQTTAGTINISVPTTASEVGALPDSTTIGDGKTVFKKNGTAFKTISANQTSSVTVDYTIPTAVTDLSDASNYALKSDVASAIIPKGSISSISNLPTLVADHRGWMYNFSAEFTTTSDFVEGSGKKYPAGTNVAIVEYTSGTYKYDIFSGFVDTTTYDNHIANTTVHVTSTEKSTWNGKQDAISDLATIRANATAGAGAATTISGYGNIVTHNTSEFATSAQGTKADSATQKLTSSNPALTASSGVCTWTITNSLANADVQVVIKEVSSNQEVVAGVTTTASTITIKMNSTSNIAANTYKAVIIG